MSSEIWNINISAQDYYKKVEENVPAHSEVIAVKVLTNTCEDMSADFDELLEDENNYEIELDSLYDEFDNFEESSEDKIKTLLSEIQILERKEKDGTITEEEQKELDAKRTEFQSLNAEVQSKTKEQSDSINAKSENISSAIKDISTKEKMAKNFGEFLIEKGTPLAETEVSSGFFKKLFGNTGADKKEAGDNALKAGNVLLGKVRNSIANSSAIERANRKVQTN